MPDYQLPLSENDLLNLWLRAGTLPRDQIRDLITKLQQAQEDSEHTPDRDELDALQVKLDDAEARIKELGEQAVAQIKDLEAKLETAQAWIRQSISQVVGP